jgi:hypothetical protein
LLFFAREKGDEAKSNDHKDSQEQIIFHFTTAFLLKALRNAALTAAKLYHKGTKDTKKKFL